MGVEAGSDQLGFFLLVGGIVPEVVELVGIAVEIVQLAFVVTVIDAQLPAAGADRKC